MKRSQPLRSKPEAKRAFVERGRRSGGLSRTARPGASRNSTLAPGKRKRKATVPPEARERALERQKGRCITPGCKGKPAHRHHVLPEQSFPEAAKDPDNIVLACPDCHMNHEFSPWFTIRREWLPQCSIDLAKRIGPRAEYCIERTYPAGDAGRPGGSGPTDEGGQSG